ncbi:MAG: alpha-galactosidase [Alphaproteobacteria bacterium]|nr:alpha-galactosidase [Alphaproteobacteria bacterium]
MLLLALAACAAPDTADAPLLIRTDRTCLRWRDGAIDLLDAEGQPIVEGAWAEATVLDADGAPQTLRTLDGAELLTVEPFTDALGAGTLLRAARPGDPELIWDIVGYDAGQWTFQLTATAGAPAALVSARPLILEDTEGGALHLGSDPAHHRVVENGSWAALDYTAGLVPGDIPEDEGLTAIAPGGYEGHSVSNWSHGVADLDSGRAWTAGALSFAHTMPVVELSARARLGDDTARFTRFAMGAAWLPAPRALDAGASAETERYWLWPDPPDVQTGLEAWADAVAANLDLVPWHRRVPGRRVPNGWNSWGGGAGTGGYGTQIDEDLMLENLAVMADELRDWGMDWFQLDDGYEPAYGDWTWRADRFPRGPAWLTAQIRAAGLRPGLWMAPFTADPDSDLFAEHPDWFADPIPLGLLFTGEYEILDLSHPEVQAWLAERIREVREDWGFEWFKLDFGYYALFGDGLYDPDLTREEAWREALTIVRDGLGEDAFFMLVGTTVMNVGLTDATRLTLDTEPWWDGDPPTALHDEQGIKPAVRTIARRWFLQDRVQINHPDLLFFRANTEAGVPPLTLAESRAHALFIGLSGGIVKLGDRLLDLQPEHLNAIRQILPIHGAAARPLDLIEREIPEVYRLDFDGGLDGFDEPWTVFGLFHWGSNQDLTTNPYTPIPDDGAPRIHRIELLEGPRLAWEMETGAFLGRVEGALEVEVPSHSARLVAVRPDLGRPQLLGWNRQVTQGGVLLGAMPWDGEALTVSFEGAAGTPQAPFVWEMDFYVPDEYALTDVEAALPVEAIQDGPTLRLRFEPDAAGPVTMTLRFRAR